MEWYHQLIILGLCVLFLFSTGIPIAFAFGILNVIGLYFLCGGGSMLPLLASSTYDSIATFSMVAIPLFVLMGETLTHTGTIELSFTSLQRWLNRLPGNLAVISVASSTLFGALSGASMASCAAVGSIMMPEMAKQGYDRRLVAGTIVGGAGLAILIPPSIMMVVYASLSNLPTGKLLLAGLVPGIILSLLYLLYVILVAKLFPKLAPRVQLEEVSLKQKLIDSRHLLSMAALIFLVVGLLYLGVASATEAAGLGAAGALAIAGMYKKLTWNKFMRAIDATAKISCMIFFILAASKAFSQILAITGASSSLAQFVTTLEVNRWIILILMQAVIFAMGVFMESLAIMFIMIPVYIPIVSQLGFDPIWFAVLIMINIEVGLMTPPFGMNLFVAKGVAPKGLNMSDVYIGVLPFVCLHFVCLVLVMVFPRLATFLPTSM